MGEKRQLEEISRIVIGEEEGMECGRRGII